MGSVQGTNRPHKVGMAQSARKAALEEGQDVANLVIDAEVKFGKLLSMIPREYAPPIVGSKRGTDDRFQPTPTHELRL